MIFSRARSLTRHGHMVQDVEPSVVDPGHHVGVGEPLQLVLVERQHHSQPVGRLAGIGHRATERVSGVVVGIRRFDVPDHRRAERGLAGAYGLQRNVPAVEHRRRFSMGETVCACSRCRAADPSMSLVPPSRVMRPGSIEVTWPIRTTSLDAPQLGRVRPAKGSRTGTSSDRPRCRCASGSPWLSSRSNRSASDSASSDRRRAGWRSRAAPAWRTASRAESRRGRGSTSRGA